jgi:hypothetical protein
MIRVLLYCIVSLILFFFLIIKLCFRFWSVQPVFHAYNPFYWLYSPGIINHKKPIKNKFFDSSIITTPFHKISTEKKALVLYFLQAHFRDRYLTKTFNKDTFYTCLELQNTNSFISLYRHGIHNKIIGYISSRILCGIANKQKIFISYLDDWTIRENYNIMNNRYKLFYSHYHNVRSANSSNIFLFKTDKLTPVIPYCTYNNYLFEINKWIRVNKHLPININCKLINEQSFALLTDIFQNIQNKFATFIIPSFTNIKNLIKNKLIVPCVLIDKTTPVAVVFFRNNFQNYKNKQLITIMSSYCRKGYEGIFKDSLTNMLYLLKFKFELSYLNLDDGSDNLLLLNHMRDLDIPKLTTKSYYYFYNYISRPIKSSNMFMIH